MEKLDRSNDPVTKPIHTDASVTHTDAFATCDPTVRGIDSIYEWCFSGLEGADGDEDYLYCTIMSAIEEYRHPERVTARTARAVDRDALLALADDLDYAGAAVENVAYIDQTFHESARRIREALGVSDEPADR